MPRTQSSLAAMATTSVVSRTTRLQARRMMVPTPSQTSLAVSSSSLHATALLLDEETNSNDDDAPKAKKRKAKETATTAIPKSTRSPRSSRKRVKTTSVAAAAAKEETTLQSTPVAKTTKKRVRGSASAAVPVTPDVSVSNALLLDDDETLPSPKKKGASTTTQSKAAKAKTAKTTKSSSPPKMKKSPPKTKKTQKQRHERPPPKEDWESLYRLVEELRADRTAPVDTDGSEALPQRDLGEPAYRFQVLIALMLSSQTKDAVVGDAMRQLQAHGLTLDNLRSTSFETLNQLIGKVGFHNTKAKNILKVADILHTQYNGDIPPTARQMIDDLPGVGPKMAFIVENVVFGVQTGIGIDTHMHRMFNQLKWVNDTKQPEHTRLQLESWLPREYWSTVNLLWVGLGQEVQQYPDKLLRKALDCSRPRDALQLLKRLGMDLRKVGTKMGWTEEIQDAMKK